MAHTGPLPKDFARTLKRRAQAISKGKTPRVAKPKKPAGAEMLMPIQEKSSLNWLEEADKRARNLHPWLFDNTILVSRAEVGKWLKFDWINDPPLTKFQLAKLEWQRVNHERTVSIKRYNWLKDNGWVTPPREPTPPYVEPDREDWILEPDSGD